MKTTFLLPCRCGRSIPIQSRHAGQTVRCPCGHETVAPTMLEMASLPQAASEAPAERPPTSWGVPQQLMLVGAVVLLVVCVCLVILVRSRPLPPASRWTEEVIAKEVDRYPPLKTILFFRFLEESGLDPGQMKAEVEYQKRMEHFWGWIGVYSVVASLGAALIGLGAWKMREK